MIKCKFSSSWRQIFENIRRVKFLRIEISYDCVVIEEYRTRTWLLLFAFSPPLVFRFSYLIFSPLAGHLVGFILVGKVLTELSSFWYGLKDLFLLLLLSGQSYPWFLKLMTSQAVERTPFWTSERRPFYRLWTDGYSRLRGERVKINYILEQNLLNFGDYLWFLFC